MLREADAPAIRAVLARFDRWYASDLLKVELRRLGRREAVEARAGRTLSLVTLSGPTNAMLEQAARLDPANLPSLDAIHAAEAPTP